MMRRTPVVLALGIGLALAGTAAEAHCDKDTETLLRFARRSGGEEAGGVVQRAERIDAQAARLNHLIDELLPAKAGGYRYSNSDPVTT